MISLDLLETFQKIPCQGAFKGVFRYNLGKNHENYNGRFPEGVQKRKSNNDDKHDHGQQKRRPSTDVEGKTINAKYESMRTTN